MIRIDFDFVSDCESNHDWKECKNESVDLKMKLKDFKKLVLEKTGKNVPLESCCFESFWDEEQTLEESRDSFTKANLKSMRLMVVDSKNYLKTMEKYHEEGKFHNELDLEDVLPMPKTQEEMNARLAEVRKMKDDLKYEFLRKSVIGYMRVRNLGYRSYQQIAFVTQGEDKIRESFPDYTRGRHQTFLIMVMLVLRKMAESCYFINRMEEAENICKKLIKLVSEETDFVKKKLKLTYGILGRLMIRKGNLEAATIYINQGLEYDPNSGILARVKVNLEEKSLKDDPSFDERFRIFGFNVFYPLVDKRFRDLMVAKEDDLSRSRHLQESFIENIQENSLFLVPFKILETQMYGLKLFMDT